MLVSVLQRVPLVSSLLQVCEIPCTDVIHSNKTYLSYVHCPNLLQTTMLCTPPFKFFCSVCTILVISVFQRLHESPDKYFLSHQEGLLSLNIFVFLFLPFYTSLFTLSTGDLSIFYLSVLCFWFLLRLTLYPSLSILTTIRHFKFLECALHDFVCIGAFYTCLYFGRYPSVQSSWETGQNKGKGFTQTDGKLRMLIFLLFFFFNWSIIQRYLVLPTKRKRNISKLRGRNPFAFRP